MANNFTDPFEALLAMQRALEARRASDWLGDRTAGTGSFPPINIFQKGDDFVAVLELAGVDKSNVNVEVKENTIRVSGQKAIKYDEGASVHRRERLSGSFDRTITVPIRIDPDGVKAEYQDGMLALFIRRAEADKPRTIRIG